MPPKPSSSPPMEKPVTCSRPSPSRRLVLKKPLRMAYTALNAPPALKMGSPRFTRRRAYTTFSMRSRSSWHSTAGMHSSRRLQLEHVTSNFLAAAMVRMAVTAYMAFSCSVLGGGACGDHVPHLLDVTGLVEEIPRREPRGKPAVGVGSEAGQHVEVDLGRDLVHGAQHVQAAALREPHVEQHDVGALGEDVLDRLVGAPGGAD